VFVKDKIDGKRVCVDVSRKGCKNYACYSPHRYQHRSYNGTEGSMTSTDKHYSCSYRNYHGCPENPKNKKEAN